MMLRPIAHRMGKWQRANPIYHVTSRNISNIADGYARHPRAFRQYPPRNRPQDGNHPIVSHSKITFAYQRRLHSTYSNSNSHKSLRHVLRPFLRACHPDATPIQDSTLDELKTKQRGRAHLSQSAKTVNLHAVQTLNGLVDTLEDLIARCTRLPTRSESTSLPELKERYAVEFILPSSSNRSGEKILTSREVVIEFPGELRLNVKRLALTDKSSDDVREEGMRVAGRLRQVAFLELRRLLRIAGLEDGAMMEEEQLSQEGNERKNENQWTLTDHFLHELGIEPTADTGASFGVENDVSGRSKSAFFGRNASFISPPPTYSHPHLHEQRQAFIKSIPWDKFAVNYDKAFLDAKADWTISRMKLFDVNSTSGRERRKLLVSSICGRVRILAGPGDTGGADDDEFVDIPEGLDVVQQLIAIRRLSVILYDNFDYLNMERMGRMWENLVIVLTPPRKSDDTNPPPPNETNIDHEYSELASVSSSHSAKKMKKWERKIKRREKAKSPDREVLRRVARSLKDTLHNNDDNDDTRDQSAKLSSSNQTEESGFKFSYGSQSDHGSGQVTAYIPIDFKDRELVKQLFTHLYDYFDNVCGDSGFLNYHPDGGVTSNMDEMEPGNHMNAGKTTTSSERL